MIKKIFFTPGPSELYPTVPDHYQEALNQKIGSISHRSRQFQDIYKQTTENLRELLQLPASYKILFLSSATEIWERILQNCVEKESFHCVNGSFSKRFYEFSQEMRRHALKSEAPFGEGFYPEKISIPDSTEAICLTQNETSSGVSMSVEDINRIREKSSSSLIFVDSVSSLPYPEFDFSKINSTYFSVQKCFGLPAGLGIWLLDTSCIEKAEKLQQEGLSIGTYHSIPALLEKARNNQTPETPNVMAIYLLGKVTEDMLRTGIREIRKETTRKAEKIYAYLKSSKTFTPAVQEVRHRSFTTIVANTLVPAPEINKALEAFDMQVGTGYGSHKERQIRIANFPAHSEEQMDKLLKTLNELFG